MSSLKEIFEDIKNKHSDILGDLPKKKVNLEESSLSRIWQFVEDDKKSFSMISASRGDYSPAQNFARHDALKSMVQLEGYGFVETKGGYQEDKGDGGVRVVEEPSLFVPEMRKKDAIYLGRCFKQDSVLYKDSSTFAYISTQEGSLGQKTMDFLKGGGKQNMNMSDVKTFFSALVKGSHAGKKFLFQDEDAEGEWGTNQDKGLPG